MNSTGNTEIHGHCAPGFEGVRDAFTSNFNRGLDDGASVCVTVDGEPVVDLWAGTRDAAGELPWEEDTIVNVYSTTKTMAALTMLMLADRGVFDLHDPVARFWPEFAAEGKADVTIAHLLAHAAGLSGLDTPVKKEDLYDHDRLCSLLAAQAPWWTPGTASGYHAITQGYLLGEVVKRATGHSLGAVFRDEIAEPLGIDFHIGTGPEHDHRIGDLIPPQENLGQATGGRPDSVSARTFANPPTSAMQSRDTAWRRAEIPAANGHGNARSVARAQALLACGGELDGKRIMSEAGARRALDAQITGVDLVLNMPTRFGMGYGLSQEMMPLPPGAAFWGGWGGSLIIADLDARTTYAFVMNRMVSTLMGDPRTLGLGVAVATALAGRAA
ncbi:MAG: class A beta-lactamase-related serine hydrolase [Gammaproteobacteria bacterium]|nr:MAG: class A beta-lactamase-related serine hydrolase [Gammaproteobacteria bacterium]